MKVMTFNLRIRTKSDGENMFDFRQDRIVNVIRNEAPDVIGFQEASCYMADVLQKQLPEYYFLAHGREADYHGEAPLIAYRWDRFFLHSFEQEMLSLEPQKNGTRIEGIGQSECPRAFACAELICKENSKRFAFCNVHTDHIDQTVVFAECVMLMQNLGRRELPFVLTGDFNATPDTLAIKMVNGTAEAMGTVDATSKIETSFHGYGKRQENLKIDYIFTNLPTDPSESYAVPNPKEGFYSDHFALCAYTEL
jgi:endonuclease/exonuclease/phosphatase family metal-dependent hydrolase